MPDIAKVWQPDFARADFVQAGPDLRTGGDLETAVLNSLFSDRVAGPDDVGLGEDPHGWWGDEGARWKVGSRLWLLTRAKLTADVAKRAKDYITEALAWLIEAGVAAKVEVTTEIVRPDRLQATVTIFRRDGSKFSTSYDWAWA